MRALRSGAAYFPFVNEDMLLMLARDLTASASS